MISSPPQDAILLGTIALEPNRWTTRTPSFRVSEILPWVREVGFDGLELWGPHFADSDDEERSALIDLSPPVLVYGGYTSMRADGAAGRVMEAEAAAMLSARMLKFNQGADPAAFDEEVANVLQWLDILPPSTALLCECHPGTTVDTPAAAARAFARWPEDRVFAIVHPLVLTPDELDGWFDALGKRIVHAHMQTRTSDGVFLSLVEDQERLYKRVEQMRARGFIGSWTIEFVKGTRTESDLLPYLMEQASADLITLSSVLGREVDAPR